MIPTQDQCNQDDPEERVLWALRNLPNVGGVGQVTHPDILRKWSKHIDDCGFIHVDRLNEMADENGFIHVSQLPEQKIKFQLAPRGPRHDYNPAAQWVNADTPEPEVMKLPDIRLLTPQENAAMIAQYRAAGMIPDLRPQRDFAEELN
ncbi:phage gene 29 protein family protein [Nocardia abscessus]|uniref:phage gene 29 protein family protein n=1 Tax=Nocardia abscessus TaxID=120957 RepID=UPI0024539491|nr:DUF2744 domain-containing protein [Nocardia abscessus]